MPSNHDRSIRFFYKLCSNGVLNSTQIKDNSWYITFDSVMKTIEKCDFSDTRDTRITLPFSEYVISKSDEIYPVDKERILQRKTEIDQLERYCRIYHGSYRDLEVYSCKRAVERYFEGLRPENHFEIVVSLKYSKNGDDCFSARNPVSIYEVVVSLLENWMSADDAFGSSEIGQLHKLKEKQYVESSHGKYRGYSFHSLDTKQMQMLVEFLENNGADFEYLYARCLFSGY